jgi:hypothetical protein
MSDDRPVGIVEADTMGGLDRRLLLEMLYAVQVGEKILFEDFDTVFGSNWRRRQVCEQLADILRRFRRKGFNFVTIRHVGFLRLPAGARPRRVVFGHLDREIWAMAEAAPRAKLPA